jgi:hypothetical protein
LKKFAKDKTVPPKAQFLSYDNMRGIADEFMARYHASRDIPVPIEEIVEFKFSMDIVPMPGMHSAFDVDSFISCDLTEIRVDEFVYESRPGRYRFSLAHELSHRLIHHDVFGDCEYTTIDGWKQTIASIPEKDYRIIEWQANSLGGLILVPPPELASEFQKATDRVKAVGLDPTSEAATEAIEGVLAGVFVVSPAVVHKRVEYDKLI